MFQVIKNTYASHGVGGFYRGLNSLLYFSIPKVSIRFFAFDSLKKKVSKGNGKLTTYQNFYCGLLAGMTEAIVIVTPAETLKVKLVNDQLLNTGNQMKGFFRSCYTIIKRQGLSGTYQGLLPTMLRQGSNQAVRFAIFGNLQTLFKKQDGTDPIWSAPVAGCAGGFVSTYVNTPVDVIKSKLQSLEGRKLYTGTFDCLSKIWKSEGIRGLYSGAVPRLFRACMDSTITMTMYGVVASAIDYGYMKLHRPEVYHTQNVSKINL